MSSSGERSTPRLHVVGVRHHSPACARLVRHVIREVKPRYVLIEGPSDMNGREEELLLGHELPIAIFSYAQGENVHHGSWSPFCAYSPEWVAVEEGKKAGAETRFIDLPSWDPAFLDIENRYSDRHTLASERMQALCDRMGVSDTDALWDHLFEQPLEMPALKERLEVYFRELREGDQALGRDVTREAFMSRWIAWAMREGEKASKEDADAPRDVVVVCGGYHAPPLGDLWTKLDDATPPDVPTLEGAVRTGSYLVPYTFHRLDSFVGYESGMPSPEFYQRVWESGADAAGEHMLFAAITHLRQKKQRVSPADSIAALTLARGLSTLRGHVELARVDVLDGLAAAVVKDALEAPLPWSQRGKLLRGTDAMLVEIVSAFSGDRMGKLAKGTPAPPLVADAWSELERVGVTLERTARDIEVILAHGDLAKSRVLHRLRVLGIPGIALKRAPAFGRGKTDLSEVWTVGRLLEQEPALIEAAAYGATLEAAAAARLEEGLEGSRGMARLTRHLREAALVGIGTIASRLAADVRQAAGTEASFADLGEGLADLVALHDHDVLFGAKDAPLIGEAISSAFDRGLWLFEGIDGEAGKGEVNGALALRDALRRSGTKLGLDQSRACAVMQRRSADAAAPPPIRGAAFGFLWSVAGTVDETEASHAVKSAARPETLGDFLAGLFALAREEVLRSPNLLGVVDGLIAPFGRDDFLTAIPALRMAFAWFPPREKELIARQILALHGRSEDPRKLLKLDVSANMTLTGMKVDGQIDEIERRFGLQPRAKENEREGEGEETP